MRFVARPHWPRWLMSIPMAAISEGMFAKMWVTLVWKHLGFFADLRILFFLGLGMCGMCVVFLGEKKRPLSFGLPKLMVWLWWFGLNVINNKHFIPIGRPKGFPFPNRPQTTTTKHPRFGGVKSISEESTSFTYSLWPCFVCSHSLLQIPLIAPWQQKLQTMDHHVKHTMN